MENVKKEIVCDLFVRKDEKDSSKILSQFLSCKTNIDGKDMTIYIHVSHNKIKKTSPDYFMNYKIGKSEYVRCGILWNDKIKGTAKKSGIFKYNNNDYKMEIVRNEEVRTRYEGFIDFSKVLPKKQQVNQVQNTNTEVSPF